MKLSPDSLLALFEKRSGQPLSVRHVADLAGAPQYQRRLIHEMLLALARDGRLVALRNKNFILPAKPKTAAARLSVSLRGAGFVIGAASDGTDLFIHRSNLDTALDGDTVEFEILPDTRGEEGRVVRVLERAHESIVGQLDRAAGRRGTVAPRNARINRWILVPDLPPESEAPDGAWVRVRISQWSHGMDEPLVGEIEEILGRAGERGVPVLALLRDMGIEIEFPEEVVRETARLEAPATAKELERRLDLRGERILTIDPATAKDFDDALSIETIEGGLWRLGVHIADVSHYVEPDGPLDAEALRRGTSIYPVDRVVPMLPERLSNDLCSLNPGADRYAMSVFMDVSAEGLVLRQEFAESVIRSRHRLNYEEVQAFFDLHDRRPDRGTDRGTQTGSAGAEGAENGLRHPVSRFASDIGPDLLALRDLSRALTRMRIQRGALDLDIGETEIECNPEGDAVGLHRRERLESHRLVEECMLAANETVARHLKREKIPFLYRIHDLPDPAALEKIAPILAMFGVHIRGKIRPSPEFYQPIVERLGRVDGGHIARRLLLRTLKKAEYSPVNRGHFGLASKTYCHFTSPIRRYPDLLVHRALRAWMKDSGAPDAHPADRLAAAPSVRSDRSPQPTDGEPAESLDRIANQCNLTEGKSFEVEREATNVKSMEFMKDHVGGAFEGWISSITKRGFFVELVEYPVEGFLRAQTIPGDTFAPDDNYARMIGRHTRRVFKIGQRVNVVVVRVSEMQGEMDLELREPRPGAGKRGKSKRGRTKRVRGGMALR